MDDVTKSGKIEISIDEGINWTQVVPTPEAKEYTDEALAQCTPLVFECRLDDAEVAWQVLIAWLKVVED